MTIGQMMAERNEKTILEDLKLDFAEQLYRVLEAKKMNQSDLARLLGVSRACVSRILRAEQNLTFETIAKIANVLNFDAALNIQCRWVVPPEKKTAEAWMRDNIMYIGNDLPEEVAKDTREKFVLLGTPQQMIDSVKK